MLQSRVGPASAVLMMLTALAGCVQGLGTVAGKAQDGTSAPPTASQSPAPATGLPTMTSVQHASLASLAAGRLVLSKGCFYLASTHSAKQIRLVWPYRFTSRTDPAGIYDSHGTLVARPGDEIVVGGGPEILAHIAPGTITNTQCLTGATNAWFIDSVGHK
jgi:hypothetical protein